MKFFSLFILSISFSIMGLANSIILEKDQEFYEIGFKIDLLEDPDGHLTIEDINRPEWMKKFKRSHKKIPNFGSSKSSFWARIKIQNKSDQKSWFISQNFANQDYLTFFKKRKGKWTSTITGDRFPFKKREVKDRSFSFEIKPGENSLYYFKIRGTTNRFNLTISSPKAFIGNSERDRLLAGIFLGLTVSMVLYNFFIFVSTKSLSYLYYVLFVFFYGIELFIYQGFSKRFLAPESVWISNGGQVFFGGLAGLFATLFSIFYLRLHETPKLQKIMQFFSFFWILLILSSFSFTHSFNLKNLQILALLTGPYILFCTAFRVKMNYRPANYMLLAFSFAILGQIISILMIKGFFPTNLFTKQTINIGMGLNLILLSMGLADRFNYQQERSLKKEKELSELLEKAQETLKISLEKEKTSSYHLKISTLQQKEDIEQLTTLYKKLTETKALLEVKVEERTEELHNSLKQLKKSVEEKSTFYAKISHELRTPLNGILGFSQILLSDTEKETHGDKKSDLSKRREFLQCIFSSGQSLLGLINEVHDISKLDLNKLIIKKKPFSILNMANNISTFFVDECEKKGLSFYVHFDERIPPHLIGDELRLKQILYNILGNSVKFTDRGFLKLYIGMGSIKENEVNLIIKVEDTGIGIRPENLGIIFDSFGQIDDIVPKEGGSGLGLHITKKIIEKMGGTISVSSEYKKGTLFTVEIFGLGVGPHSLESGGEDLDLQNYQFYGDTILIADDLESNLALIEAYLDPFNLKIEQVKNGIDLIDKAIQLRPSLIITDIKMPSLDGYKAAEKLSQIKKTQNIPIIGISAVQERKTMVGDFDSFMEKPLERSLLIREIAKYLRCDIKKAS